MPRLPLFPLGTVLFPGLLLPLHVFEERYQALVHDLLALPDDQPRRFGVVAIRSGHEVGDDGVRALHDVGCTAQVRRVTPRDDGRFDLVSIGASRFRVLAVDRTGPYFTADVALLAEDSGAPEQAARTAGVVARMHDAYLRALAEAQRTKIDVPDLPADPVLLSYVVAATMVLDVADRQRLLAAPDALSRLVAERRLLTRETAMLRLLSAVPDVDLTRRAVRPN